MKLNMIIKGDIMKQKITPIAHLLQSKENAILVKDSSLEKWVKEHFFSNASNAHSTMNLSKFGLKNAKDVIAFLKSPGGKLLENELIAQELSEAQWREQRLKFLLRDLFLHLLRALLFGAFLGKKSQAHTQQNMDELIAQQQRLEKKGVIKSSTASKEVESELLEQLESVITDYEKTIELLHEHKNAAKAQIAKLDELIIQMDGERKQTSEKYVILERHMKELKHLDGPDLTQASLKTMISDLRDSLEQKQDDTSPVMVALRFAKNLQMEVLRERLAVQRSEKYYLDSDLKPVISFRDAAFVLNRMMNENNVYVEKPEKILKLGDAFYLLRPGQSEQSIHENKAERDQARERFETRKLEIMPVLKRIEHERLQEFSHLNSRVETATNQLDQHKTVLVESDNHLNCLHLALNAAVNSRNNALSMDNIPRPMPAPSPRPVPEKQAFTQELEQLLKQQNLSPKPVFRFIEGKALNKTLLTQYLNQQFNQKMAMNIPLTQQDKDALLKFVKQMGTSKDEKLNHVESNTMPSPLSINLLKIKPHE